MDTTSEQQMTGAGSRATAGSSSLLTRTISLFWKKKRLVLSMFAGSLIVTAALVQLLFPYQQQTETEDTRRLGQNIAQLIAEIPYDSLDENRIRNLFKKVYESQAGASLAYVSLVDRQGRPIYEIAAPGVRIPDAVTYQEPARWYAEHTVAVDGARSALEVSAPWLAGAEPRGFIRLAYTAAPSTTVWQNAYFVALVACFAFFQALLAYAFVLREARKHQDALDGSVAAAAPSGAVWGLSTLLAALTDCINTARERIAELEDENAALITRSSIALYQHRKAEAILHTLPDGVLMFDDTGTITFANTQIAELFNTDRQQIQEGPLQGWCADESFRQYIRRILQPALAATDKLQFVIGEGAESKTLLASSHPIFSPDEGHQRIGSLLLVSDHTQQSIDESNREEFVAHICHELKTPLNTLSMYSEALLDDDNATEEFRLEALNILYDETHRMKDLINNLLNLTRIEMGSVSVNRQRVKLHDFLLDIYKNISSGAANSGLSFKLDIPDGLEDVVVDKTLFRIVISNLLTNAIKYNRPDGTVILKAEETDDSVIISVCDTGIGISEEDRKNIFEKFYRSTQDNVRQISGHGLGLALARDIVQMHNGTLSVKSEPEKGSEFVIEIRRDPELLMKVG